VLSLDVILTFGALHRHCGVTAAMMPYYLSIKRSGFSGTVEIIEKMITFQYLHPQLWRPGSDSGVEPERVILS
jgi:hypothetical protein